MHITLEALKRFDLDAVWWLISPGNPLKERGPATLARRMTAAGEMMQHPRVKISDFEAHAGTRYTAKTIAALQTARPRAQFVWLMGADNLAQFHQWRDWQDIMARVPVGVLARPGDRLEACTAPAARIMRAARISAGASQLLAAGQTPRWCFINLAMVDASSSEIRATGVWCAT